MQAISGGKPTYWPADTRKIPDIIDFSIYKNIPLNTINVNTLDELSSDHAPTLYEINSCPEIETPPERLTNKNTNWKKFHDLMENKLCPNIRLNSEANIESTLKYLNNLIANCAREATPNYIKNNERTLERTSRSIQYLLRNKREAKRLWQNHRSPRTKALLNSATKALKTKLQEEKNRDIQEFVQELSPTADTNYSLWKVTKKVNRPILADSPIRDSNGIWIRKDSEKAEEFAAHLEATFKPNKQHNTQYDQYNTNQDCTDPSIEKITLETVLRKMREINPNKAPGHDLITGKILKELPIRAKCVIRDIFNAIIKLNYFPETWKLAKIIMIPKPGKDRTQVKSYRPISLLPILSKLFERILLEKMLPHINQNGVLPNHQFGFRNKHSTIEQVHKISNCIKTALDENKYCTGVFLDIAQAFDKVWHEGLIFKIKQLLPRKFHQILVSYLKNRRFKVSYKDHTTEEHPIAAGVPQGSVLGPILYIIFTADLPISNDIITTTFADDTAVLYAHQNRLTATRELQHHIKKIETWSNKWGIKINEEKSAHITFTLKRRNCRNITLNNKIVPQVDTVKYLGLHLDKKLTWKYHIMKKKSKSK